MKLASAQSLALLACLPAAAGASAGTVTLLSQERSVSASIDGSDVFVGSSPVGGVLASDARSPDGFGLFDETIDFTLTAEDLPDGATFPGISFAFASQRSEISEAGNDVVLSFSGASRVGFNLGNNAGFVFAVNFELEEATAYELQGTGFGEADGPMFTFVDADGDTVRDLAVFDVSRPMDSSGRYDFTADASFRGDPLDNTGILVAGSYTFGVEGNATFPGADPGSISFDGFGLILRDSTLAGGETPPTVAIPSPAALPAGLAMLGAGLLRRKR